MHVYMRGMDGSYGCAKSRVAVVEWFIGGVRSSCVLAAHFEDSFFLVLGASFPLLSLFSRESFLSSQDKLFVAFSLGPRILSCPSCPGAKLVSSGCRLPKVLPSRAISDGNPPSRRCVSLSVVSSVA